MILLSAKQIKDWDHYTIQQEPISSINLMERAAKACVHWIMGHISAKNFYIFCSIGNNGGDGLAIARLLYAHHIVSKVFILDLGNKQSEDFRINLNRLQNIPNIDIHFLKDASSFPPIPKDACIIDAIFGTGLNRKPEGITASLIYHINSFSNTVIAIDMPSGLLCDSSSKGFTIIQATHTLSFQCYKLALLIPENEIYFGTVHIIDIHLHPNFKNIVDPTLIPTSIDFIRRLYKPRKAFAHKGNFGHALIISGSYGKMGAAVLSTKACLRSGVGLVTSHIPQCGLEILQTSVPEAMCKVDKHEKLITAADHLLHTYSAIGIGPGIGNAAETAVCLKRLISSYKKPIVIDADAINILAENKEWLNLLPENSILTPHPKEFTRLFGNTNNDFEKIEIALQQAHEKKIIIILKGHRSFIATPIGKGYFNTTGNAGMATGGSGDVLTGIITGLLAQGYSPTDAAILGVYLHGLAGDKACEKYGANAMIATDIIEGMAVIKQFQEN